MKTINFILLLFVTVFFWQCQKDAEIQPKDFPFVVTNDVTQIDESGVNFSAEIMDSGEEEITEFGFIWSYHNNVTIETADFLKVWGNNPKDKTFTYRVNGGLKKDCYYYVRSYLKTRFNTIYGNTIEFKSIRSQSPEINSFTPDFGKAGTKIEIEGNNFALSKTENFVKIGDVVAIIDSFSETKLIVTLPEFTIQGKVKISVETADMKTESNTMFDLWFPWRKIQDFPGEFRNNMVHFVIGNKAYLGLGTYHKDLWEYNPETDIFEKKADFPGEITDWVSGFSINKKGYILIYRSEFNRVFTEIWEYDPNQNNWIQKSNFPADNNIRFVPLIIGNRAFLVADTYENEMPSKSFWEYNYESDTWTKRENFPGNSLVYGLMGCSSDNFGFIGIDYIKSNQLGIYKYDPGSDKWSLFTEFPGIRYSSSIAFSIANNLYFGASEESSDPYLDFWKYDPVNNIWSTIKPCPLRFSPRIGFSIGNKGYVGVGTYRYYDFTMSFYEFDPSKN